VADLVKREDLENADVIKHAGAIHISGRLTLTQRKASNILLYNAFDELPRKEEHRIRVRDLARFIGTSSNNLDHIKDALRGLALTPIEWNLLDEVGKQKEWGITTFLAHATIRGGYCYYSYSPELRRKLHNPAVYAKINLEAQKKISGSHAFVIYENCLRFINVGSTGWLPLETFRRLLFLHENSYFDDFRKLNEKVIKPALKDLNATSDIQISVEFRRERRRVTALRFKVSRKPQMDLFHKETPAEEGRAVVENGLQDQLYAFGLTERQAAQALQNYDEAYLREKIKLAEEDYRAGKVRHLGRYTYTAIRDNYQKGRSPLELQAEAEKKRRSKGERRKMLEDTLAAIEREFGASRLQNALGQLPAGERTRLEETFVQALMASTERGDGVIRELYRKSGFNSPVVKANFHIFAKSRLLSGDAEQELIGFAKGKGYDLAALREELRSLGG
jgi:plasmid replication initiation protein